MLKSQSIRTDHRAKLLTSGCCEEAAPSHSLTAPRNGTTFAPYAFRALRNGVSFVHLVRVAARPVGSELL